MTSENPFDNGGGLATAVKGRSAVTGDETTDAAGLPDDPETGEPTDLIGDGSGEKLPPMDAEEQLLPPDENGSIQLQPPTDESDVDDESTGENPADDVVDATVVADEPPLDAEAQDQIEQWKPPPFPSIEPDWQHDTIVYAGFTLGVRIPLSQALTGFTMATGAYIDDRIKTAMVSMFVNRHFSPQSYAFLMMRLMDPDATDFNEDTFGDIVRMLVEKAGERVVAEHEAKQKAIEMSKKKPARKGKRT